MVNRKLRTVLTIAFTIVLDVGASPSSRIELNARQASLPAGWSVLGCYTDSTSARTLKTAAFTSVDNMTIESCLSFCTPAAYNFAGVEFARECYCDNIIEAPGAPATDGCNMICTGNAAEICGGANRINIFTHTPTSTTQSTTTTTTTSISTTTTAAPTPTIVRNVLQWSYKGCYVDIGPRDLSHQVSVPAGVTAESCTSACEANGFGLAGLEFGQECWCDNYLPYGAPAPDTDCNMPCQANTSELCGAGNRIAVYQNAGATPLDPNLCIVGRDFTNFHLQAVPVTGSPPAAIPGGPVRQVYAVTLNFNGNNAPQYTILSTCTSSACGVEFFNFNMDNNGVVSPFGLEGPPEPIPPTPGSTQVFIAFSTTPFTPFNGFCPKPNPVSPNGTFIGFPALSVLNHSDEWALCTNTTAGGRLDVVFSPIANSPDYSLSQCQSTILQMSQPYAFIPPSN